MSKAGFYRILCVIALGIFIAFSLYQGKEITKSASQIMEQVTSQAEIKDLKEADISQLEENFSLSRDDFESFSYIKSEDIMNVREVLVIKLREGVDSKRVADAVDGAAEEKYNTYKDYDADAAAILKSRVVRSSRGVVFYIAHENAETAYEAFSKSLKD